MRPLPENFARIQEDLLGDGAAAWLAGLPDVVTTCAERWDLTPGSYVEPLTYNYIVRVRLSSEDQAILKICTPGGDGGGEYAGQAAALRLFDGRGAVRLLKSDPVNRVMLLECCEPGAMVSAIEDDDAATAIAASVMQQLWHRVPPSHPFPTVAKWGQGFARLRARYNGGSGPLPAELVDQAEHLYVELVRSTAQPVVLHGDLHHDNVLSAARQPWLAIDPKGVVGDPAYETSTFIRNQLPEPPAGAETARLLRRRIDQLSEQLNLDRARVRGWALAVTVLAAWENIEDHGRGWEDKIAIADHLAVQESW
jgi:streptomycin 6-kinase